MAPDIAQSFSHNQIVSKMLLCEWIEEDFPHSSVTFLGGWFCTLPPLMFKNHHSITSVDIDPRCAQVKLHPEIVYHTADVATYKPLTEVVVNSSVEHMDVNTLHNSFALMSPMQTVYLMSNNMNHVDDHVNTHASLDTFVQQMSRWVDVHDAKVVMLRKGYERYVIKGNPK